MHLSARRRRRLPGVVTTAAVAAATLLLAPSPAGAGAAATTDAAPAACNGDWQTVFSPNPGGTRDVLRGVAARDADDAWAVGASTSEKTGATRPLTMHWDGRDWHDRGSGVDTTAVLSGVAVVGATDAWAVGHVAETDVGTRPLALRWDGDEWRRVPVPRIVPGTLTSVSGAGPNDVWAVGAERGPEPDAILLHWDGAAWTQFASPLDVGPGAAVAVQDVLALSPTEAWAVGSVTDDRLGQQPLALHWDGRSWTKVRVPDTGTRGSALEGVTRTTTGDVWVVGRTLTDTGDRPLALRWRHHSWLSPHPPLGEAAARFEGVAPLPGGRVLAVGFKDGEEPWARPIAQVHDGTGWRSTRPDEAPIGGYFFDVATVPDGPISWAVGDRGPDYWRQTLVQRRCG